MHAAMGLFFQLSLQPTWLLQHYPVIPALAPTHTMIQLQTLAEHAHMRACVYVYLCMESCGAGQQ
jgi:hypothetical protein